MNILICKICKKKTRNFLSLIQYQRTGLYFKKPVKSKKSNINLLICNTCSFLFKKTNNRTVIDYKKINRKTSSQLQPYCKELVRTIFKKTSPQDIILEIGSNDGTFLDKLRLNRKKLYGFEPSESLANLKNNKKYKIYNTYFDRDSSKKFLIEVGIPKIIILRHTLEHIFNINQFIKNVKTLFNNKTIGLIEVPDSDWIFQNSFYHEIWDEHENYFTKNTLKNFLLLNGFEIKKVQIKRFRDTRNIIFWIRLSSNQKIQKQFVNKKKINMSIKKWKKNSIRLINSLKRAKKPIVGVGAGHNQLNFYNFSKIGKFLNFLIDEDKNKVNKYVNLGHNVKIISLSNMKKNFIGSIILSCFPFPDYHKKIKQKYKSSSFIKPYDI